MEKIRSAAADEACTPKYFIASVARLGKRTLCFFQKSSADIETVLLSISISLWVSYTLIKLFSFNLKLN